MIVIFSSAASIASIVEVASIANFENIENIEIADETEVDTNFPLDDPCQTCRISKSSSRS